jgi:hypothetical protein
MWPLLVHKLMQKREVFILYPVFFIAITIDPVFEYFEHGSFDLRYLNPNETYVFYCFIMVFMSVNQYSCDKDISTLLSFPVKPYKILLIHQLFPIVHIVSLYFISLLIAVTFGPFEEKFNINHTWLTLWISISFVFIINLLTRYFPVLLKTKNNATIFLLLPVVTLSLVILRLLREIDVDQLFWSVPALCLFLFYRLVRSNMRAMDLF